MHRKKGSEIYKKKRLLLEKIEEKRFKYKKKREDKIKR